MRNSYRQKGLSYFLASCVKSCIVKYVVVEREGRLTELKRYGFVSTGNFNESTARISYRLYLFHGPRRDIKGIEQGFRFFETPIRLTIKQSHCFSTLHLKNVFKKLID